MVWMVHWRGGSGACALVVMVVDVVVVVLHLHWWCVWCTGDAGAGRQHGSWRRSSSTRGRAEEFTKYFHKNMVGLRNNRLGQLCLLWISVCL